MKKRRKTKLFSFLLSFMLVFQFIPMAETSYAAGGDITSKVTIDKITARGRVDGTYKPVDLKSSTDPKDYNYALDAWADVKLELDFTVNKGTPIEDGDYVSIPMNADHGMMLNTTELEIRDTQDGSLLGYMDILNDKINFKFKVTKPGKTAARVHANITLKGVHSIRKTFKTQEEYNKAKATKPADVCRVKFLNKDANMNVKAQYDVELLKGAVDPTPSSFVNPSVTKLRADKHGYTQGDSEIRWTATVRRMSKENNQVDNGYWIHTKTPGGAIKDLKLSTLSSIAYVLGYDVAYGDLPKGKNVYVEDTFPADKYKDVSVRLFDILGSTLIDEGTNTNKIAIQGRTTSAWGDMPSEMYVFDKSKMPPKKQKDGQTYEQFKASLGIGEYGLYKDKATGDITFVMNYGDIGSKDPSKMLTWGKLYDIFGKEHVINRAFPRVKISATGDLEYTNSKESETAVYNKIKDWPAVDFTVELTVKTAKPVRVGGQKFKNTARINGENVTGEATFEVNNASLKTHLDGMTILKTDSKTGFGIEGAKFELQEKKPDGSWVASDISNITFDGSGKKDGKLLVTDANGLLRIRGLKNGTTYRLVEKEAPIGYKYDPANPVITKEAKITFANESDKENYGGFEQLDLKNTKEDYTVTYKIVKNPEGEEIPEGSPGAPTDSTKYNYKSSVKVKDDLTFAGYKFTGWHTKSGAKVNVGDNDAAFTMPAGNVELEGYWTLITKDIDIKYESENATMGTVDSVKETVNDVKGTAKGSTATANPGYELVGWYDKSDSTKTILSTDAKFIPKKDSTDKKYHEKTYVAKFKEKGNISIKYESEDLNKGTVDNSMDTIAPATGTPKGSTPTAKPGYKFDGWYDKATGQRVNGTWIDSNNKLIPQKIGGVYEAKTYVAKFREDDDVTIKYEAETGGKVSNAGETLKPVTGVAKGSSAAADEGYKFMGWYDKATGMKVDDSWISAGNKLIPQKKGGVYEAKTYLAKFRKNAVTKPSENFTVTKTLTGEKFTDNSRKETFKFKLTSVNRAPMPEKSEIQITTDELLKGNLKANKSFGEIEFSEPGTYKYEIREMAGTDTVHFEYAGNKATITVVVEANADNSMLTVKKVDGKANFENKYLTESGEGNFIPAINKVVTGPVGAGKDKEFTFQITAEDNAPMPEKSQIKIAGNGSGNFGKVKYTKQGEYRYVIKEVVGTEKGYTYSKDEYMVTVKTEDRNGKIVVSETKTALNGKKVDSIVFTNTYKPLEITTEDSDIVKSISGDSTPKDERFNFTLKAADIANPMPTNSSNGVKEYSIIGRGRTNLGVWKYAKTGIYRYKLTEKMGGIKGYKYDETVYTITDTVVDNDGQLEYTRKITDQNGNEVASKPAKFNFVNKFTVPKVNKPHKPAKTGDIVNIGLYTTGILLSLFGLCWIFMRRKAIKK